MNTKTKIMVEETPNMEKHITIDTVDYLLLVLHAPKQRATLYRVWSKCTERLIFRRWIEWQMQGRVDRYGKLTKKEAKR